MRFSTLFTTLIFLVAGLSAQEITRVAVLDYSMVLKEFPRQSRELRRIAELKAEVQEEMARLKEELTQLQEELRAAQDKDKNTNSTAEPAENGNTSGATVPQQTMRRENARGENHTSSRSLRRIQNDIQTLRDYGVKYVKSKNEEIRSLQEQASRSSSASNLQQILPDIISQVAREQGYSVILDKNSQNIIWLDTSIDITETVLQRLRKRLNG